MKIMEILQSHLKMIHDPLVECKFNQIVVTGYFGRTKNDQGRIGKIVQIREGSGQFGSNIFLLRRLDGRIGWFENIELYEVKPEFLESYSSLFEGKYEDSENEEYSLRQERKERGFIVKENEEDIPDTASSFTITTHTPSD